ncbi:beta-ketoacyl-[acyl-carrier-protein] synthase II|nr:beta-ketoacyl-[acyl-carrier-protein] synthase II [Candidatus Pantoea persica]
MPGICPRPIPRGEGAQRAMQMALQSANLSAQAVVYINLHGTATPLNDQIASNMVHRLFGDQVPSSSTKHLTTGHMLCAAGVIEAALAALILRDGLLLPAQDFSTTTQDSSLPPCGLLLKPQPLQKPVIASNSFAFGGNNSCLILGRTL